MRWSKNEPGGLLDGGGDGRVLKYYSTASLGDVRFRCWKGQSRKQFEAYAFAKDMKSPFVVVHATTARGAKMLVLKAAKKVFAEVWERCGK